MGVKLPLPTVKVNSYQCHKGPVLSARLNDEGEYSVTAGKDSNVILSNPYKGRVVATFSGHNGPVHEAVSSADNTKLASGGDDKIVMLWDVATQRFLRKFRGHLARVNCVGFNEDSSVLFSGSYDATVRIWDCRSKGYEPIQVLNDAKDSVTTLHVSGTDLLFGCVDGTVRVYDMRNRQVTTDTVGHPVTSVRLSNDKQCVLLSTLQDLLVVLDRSNGQVLTMLKGHKNSNYKVDSAFTAKDAYIVSGSETGDVHYWELISGKKVHTIETGSSGVYTIDYNEKRDTLLTGSVEGHVTLWGLGKT